jgi:ABC-2 type transport system ATP-binding protein
MLLDMVGLSGAAYRRVGEYSKGMQRRIGMAQALINDPDLLILDEPTSGMDPLAARQFKDLIGELARRGKTIILSSHLLADMEDLCDRVAILFAGQLRSEGTLDELLARRSLTQITTERLDGDTLSQLMAVLARAGKEVLSVETPKDKLETLFLRIIHDAQRQRTSPQTAVNTGQLAEFLRATPGQPEKQVLEELLAPAAEPKPETPEGVSAQSGQAQGAAVEPPPAPASQEVLAELTDSPARQTPTAQSASPESAQPMQADQAVIDELLGKDKENDGRA